jgi:hypothetical protein
MRVISHVMRMDAPSDEGVVSRSMIEEQHGACRG